MRTKKCSCGAENLLTSKTCGNCGKKLHGGGYYALWFIGIIIVLIIVGAITGK